MDIREKIIRIFGCESCVALEDCLSDKPHNFCDEKRLYLKGVLSLLNEERVLSGARIIANWDGNPEPTDAKWEEYLNLAKAICGEQPCLECDGIGKVGVNYVGSVEIIPIECKACKGTGIKPKE